MEDKSIKVAVSHEALATYFLDPESNNESCDSTNGLEKSATSHI